MEFPSKLIENAVGELSKLPGVGKKTALRLALHLLKAEADTTATLAEALAKMRFEIRYCDTCHNISDTPECTICANKLRDHSTVCVVSDIRDVIAIENTGQYKGTYHVLGGVISPIEGVGPSDLQIDSLVARMGAPESEVKEVILAISPTMEGDTTAFFLSRKLRDFEGVHISTIARGIPMGGELEYADEITLGRSIVERQRQAR
ncbi:recombination protein RecR [Microvirga sp. STR05]|uniref:Recombination protein RecR n=2 Tax=Hymenobacter TaxID=89966 RepID=A0A7G7W4K5_9BACT|nr:MULTISPECIES: recombination mediator RecR [Hymenobacter]MBD2715531.1 recombination protein RecR [Hymenobacter duratus]MBR7950439.1 recombination protein RecR [Microvirga sp. STR05]QNH61298.1 recombination protein RecR [Hymenobacter sediminicola]